MIFRICILFFSNLIVFSVFAQEVQFNQFYSNAPYINPAFTGDSHHLRGSITSRISSPIPGEYFATSVLSVDQKIKDYRSGFGLVIYNQNQTINHFKAQLSYSYTIKLTELFSVKGGLGISFNQRKTGSKGFTYPDQYNNLGFTGNPSNEPSLDEKIYYPGLNAGIVLYAKYFWLGSAFDQINTPTENFAGADQQIPIKYSIHGGLAYPIHKHESSRRRFSKYGGLEPYTTLGPIFSFTSQGQYSHMNIGLSVHSQPFFGCINYVMINQFIIDRPSDAYKAIGITAGFRREEIAIAYTYEISLISSKVNKNGTHEISLSYYFSSARNDHKRNQLVPLPNQILY